MLTTLLLTGLPLLVAPTPSSGGGGRVFLTKEEALELAFPECEIERRTLFLTEEQREAAEELAGFDVGKSVVYAYVATRDGAEVGTAWFDAHKVRSKKETLMVVVGTDHRIRRLELLAFAEPPEYVPNGKWYAQFVGKRLDADLDLERGIKGVTGATLTARATTRAARLILAVHEVVFPRGS
jgi:hypothetical protein